MDEYIAYAERIILFLEVHSLGSMFCLALVWLFWRERQFRNLRQLIIGLLFAEYKKQPLDEETRKLKDKLSDKINERTVK